ncbi:MAG: hypothetical protein DMG26_11910 [Acidobacteria bacterium]|nr:MAG: hypothetical protein DMG26_11910 [Acidobacteriota bacterium]
MAIVGTLSEDLVASLVRAYKKEFVLVNARSAGIRKWKIETGNSKLENRNSKFETRKSKLE